MNKENLLRMADYIETIPQEKFDMYNFRKGDKSLTNCNSVGCVIGHCTGLDNNPLPMLNNNFIDFYRWSEKFTGIVCCDEWEYLFGPEWSISDNTPTGAAKRIRYFVENGLPEDYDLQMLGYVSLTY